MTWVDMQRVIAYTDGSCHPNPGPGGWGVVLIYKDVEKELWGGAHNVTNNIMELTAAVQALTALKRPCHVDLYTDSKYVQQGFEQYRPTWKKNGWITYEGKPVKNRELWEELDCVARPHRAIFHWVRGHVGTYNNERADMLARRGRDEIRPFGESHNARQGLGRSKDGSKSAR